MKQIKRHTFCYNFQSYTITGQREDQYNDKYILAWIARMRRKCGNRLPNGLFSGSESKEISILIIYKENLKGNNVS